MATRLNDCYKDNCEWLRFAESKNAAITILNITVCGFLYQQNSASLTWYIMTVIALLLVSTFIAMFSTVAQIFKLDLESIYNDVGNIGDDGNLLFYKHICRYHGSGKHKDYLRDFVQANRMTNVSNDYLLWLSSQIIEISKITYKKYRLFNIALCVDLLVIVFILVMLIIP